MIIRLIRKYSNGSFEDLGTETCLFGANLRLDRFFQLHCYDRNEWKVTESTCSGQIWWIVTERDVQVLTAI